LNYKKVNLKLWIYFLLMWDSYFIESEFMNRYGVLMVKETVTLLWSIFEKSGQN
ncbi:MAG: hypothetical protein K0Q85_1016, partial [Caproiciproducens sp.]|nr:hypothetical protein [Caproiciproducens sp.]